MKKMESDEVNGDNTPTGGIKPAGEVIVIIKRPETNNEACYLYNVLLRKLSWEKVTMMIRDPANGLVEKLKSRGISHYIFNANGSVTTAVQVKEKSQKSSKLVKKLVKLMVKAKIDSNEFNVIFDEKENAEVMKIYAELNENGELDEE
jgi:hypothetical protein